MNEKEMSQEAIDWLEHARQYPQDLHPRNMVEHGMIMEHISKEERDYIFKVVSHPS